MRGWWEVGEGEKCEEEVRVKKPLSEEALTSKCARLWQQATQGQIDGGDRRAPVGSPSIGAEEVG